MKKYSILYITIFLAINVLAQPKPNIQGWRVHLPYVNNKCIDRVNNQIYCGSNSGIFTFDINTREVERLSKITGLSDVEVKLLKYNAKNNVTVVLYKNTNIDLIYHSNKTIVNLPDVLQKQIIGEKSLNNIFFADNKAYVAASFGLLVIDLQTKQISESYQNLGPGATTLAFNDVCIQSNTIFAAAENGIYAASLSAPNLSDYKYWTLIKASNGSRFCTNIGTNLLVEVDSTLQVYDGITFSNFAPVGSQKITNLTRTNNQTFVVLSNSILKVESNLTTTSYNQTFKNGACLDAQGRLCMVDNNYGLTIELGNNLIDYIIPNGPLSTTIGKFTYAFDKLWQTGGEVTDKWDEAYNSSKFSTFSNNNWQNFWLNNNPDLKDVSDFLEVKKHPYADKIYLSSFGYGVFEFDGTNFLQKYDDQNSSLQRFNTPGFTPLRVSGLDFDNNGNLWVSNFGVNKPLSVKTKNGWTAFSVGTLLGGNEIGYLSCDDYNNKWVVTIREKGLLVYNDNGTPENVNDDQYKLYTKDVGQGGLPSNQVYCITKDLNGEMWVGTSQGLAIISNPNQVFNEKNIDYDARQIIIQTGNYYSIFLGTEIINCIKVDPANRKWIGTRNGVWLVSPDGYTVIHNFTTNNSPLLSNNVLEIGIEEKSGEVFFATDKGMVSYMGTATAADNNFGKVEIYPNPVEPTYDGLIAIKGLANNATVKITDISGNLVYETTANGGFATWDGKNFNHRRVSTGVYLIMSSNKDASQTHVGKILFIN